ncbi:MAG: ABC-2 family transporter protein [Armatimonadetes bacterium]|nr:ABC-2 family transporter protein [Armatimonadota bacterium]
MTTLRRYLRLYRVFWETCIAREAEFRANFWANIFTNSGWLIFFVLFIKVIYRNTNAIAGWTEGEAITLTGTFGLVQSAFATVAYQNLSRIPEMVRLGTLDFVLTKPVNSQFFVSTRYVRLDSLGNLAGSLIVIAYGVHLGGLTIHPVRALAYALLVLCALVIYYSIYMLLMTLSFWFIRLDNLAVLADMVIHIGRYPTQIFGGWPRWFLTYVLPLAFMATIPVQALYRSLPGWLPGVGVLLATGLFVASLWFWQFGLRCYTSASS